MSVTQPVSYEIEHWNHDLEMVVKRDGEQCQSLYWMHDKASNWAITRNDGIQIPAIILASATGFLSATSVLVPPIAIGAMSLTVGILNTVNSYFKFSQRSEAHRMSAQMYMKAYKIIETELALPIHQREHALKILSDLRETMSRISEIAPPLPTDIISAYNKSFKESSVAKPIIANGLTSITVCLAEPTPDENNYNMPSIESVEQIPVPPLFPIKAPVITADISANTVEPWPSAVRKK
jgi:hypothetical protein